MIDKKYLLVANLLLFRIYVSSSLVLMKEGFSKSRWGLSDIFRKVQISCHKDENWKPEGYFQTNGIGQEFVVHADKQVEKWAKELIDNF